MASSPSLLVPGAKLKILDFDIENRPLSYLGMDFTTSDITAIAAGFEGESKIAVWLLGEHSQKEMLVEFVKLYDEADIVTGHYIRRHDLPIINGALMEHHLPPLSPKLTSDTKVHMRTRSGISASQESLSDMLGVTAPKYHMTQAMWRSANRLTPEGIAETKRRVVGDIRQHKQLRKLMLEHGMLRPPEMWRP